MTEFRECRLKWRRKWLQRHHNGISLSRLWTVCFHLATAYSWDFN